MRRFGFVLGVALLMVPRPGLAQTRVRTTGEARIFVDVHLAGGASVLDHGRTFASRFVAFGEVGSGRATYPRPSRATVSPLLDVGGGVMFTRSLGLAIGYSRTSSDDLVGLETTVPHPRFLNAPASATAVTNTPLTRQERAAHLSLVLVPVQRRQVELRLLVGPSVFWYTADMVSDIQYVQTFDPVTTQNAIAITGFGTDTARVRTLGLHAGGDLTYFFNRVLGVGTGVRFSWGTVTVSEPMSQQRQQIRLGGTLGFLGVRIRFSR
jgi:hypothetical protein